MLHRQLGTGVYCPSLGELLLIGGRTSHGFTYPSADSMALFIPIERPAGFSWKSGGRDRNDDYEDDDEGDEADDRGLDRHAKRHRSGILRFPEDSEAVSGFEDGSVRLVNCETEQTLATAHKVRRQGRNGWLVRFKNLGPEVAEAEARGRLVLTGRPLGAPVNFLAPLPGTGREAIAYQRRDVARPTWEADPDAGTEPTEPGALEVRALRAPGGWRIECAGFGVQAGDLAIYDVGGRLRYRREGAFQGRADERASYLWDGRGDGGQTLPKGIYFARVTAGAESATAKLLIW